MENSEIGKRIKQRRNDMEISVMELAKTTGLSKATLHRYESGDIKNIKIPVIKAIALRLGVSPDWLMGKTDIIEQEISHERTTDINIIIDYALKLIRSDYFTNKGRRIPKEIIEVIDLTLEYQLKLLEAQINDKDEEK